MKKLILASLVAASLSAFAQEADQQVVFPKSSKPSAAPVQAQLPAPPVKQGAAPALAAKIDVPRQAVAEQPLPGLGVMPGERQLTKSNVLRVSSDRNEIVYVSASMPNRIATPFAEPRLIDVEAVDFVASGQSLYVLPKDASKPVGIYVTGSNPNDPVISMTLVPKAIPQQTIVLQLDAAAAEKSAPAEAAPSTDVYTDRIRYLMRSLALNKVPDGFVEGALPAAQAVGRDILIKPLARYSGQAFDIYRYKVVGTSLSEVELNEESFFTDGVRAVAFFPTAVLQRGQETFVFVIADKSANGG